ncbi:uncharacterized protein [Palaemon carinicauda]|uniref:uncharacterized protein isoform X2 n=1 Tax=Palaemon carinicauda TaxID=392227 RepID=UPI0035B67DBC
MVSKVTAEELMELAAKAGEVRYVRLGLECNGTKNALVESSEQPFNNISAENASSGIHGTAHQSEQPFFHCNYQALNQEQRGSAVRN